MTSQVEVIKADYKNPRHAADLVKLLNEYATDPMGGGKPISDKSKANLADSLAQLNYAFSVIAYVDGQAAGVANCFEGFSTFKCMPLVNIHDLAVSPNFRGHKLSYRLLEKIEEIARDKGSCKITLEVLEKNPIAQKAYLRYGFEGYELDPELGKALFWEKPLK